MFGAAWWLVHLWQQGQFAAGRGTLGAWFLATGTGLVDSRILASPADVVTAARTLIADGSLQENLLVSLQRAMIGLAIGVALGAFLALVAGLSRFGEYLLDANLQMLRSLPILALVPLAIVWFGIVPLPDWVMVDKDFAAAFLKPLHVTFAFTLAAFVVLHVLATLKHQWIDRDGLFWRMWPRGATPRSQGS